MLDSKTLQLAAEALDFRAATIEDGRTYKELHPLLIAAEDCRREVQAASGYANTATLALRRCVDNDKAMADALTERARTLFARSTEAREAYASHAGDGDARAIMVSYLADDLRDWLRDTACERAAEHANHYLDAYTGDVPLNRAAVDMISAMAHHALSEVDWIGVAREYLDRAEGVGEWAPQPSTGQEA
jgi:hypothetical protein